jgi:hypothetical protein
MGSLCNAGVKCTVSVGQISEFLLEEGKEKVKIFFSPPRTFFSSMASPGGVCKAVRSGVKNKAGWLGRIAGS